MAPRPSNVTALRRGRRLPNEVLAAHRRDRVLRAFAKLIIERGYAATHIGHLVKAAGVARKTLYETFSGKGAAAEALVAEVCPSMRMPLRDVEGSGLDLFAIEVAAERFIDGSLGSTQVVRALEGLLEWDSPSPVDEALLCTLPPGRHGLPPEFVVRNQQHRLLLGFATTVARNGYPNTTVADVTREAHVSRRTFYAHFEDRGAIASALLSEAPTDLPAVDATSGLGAMAVEVAAAWFADQVDFATEILALAQEVLEAARTPEVESLKRLRVAA